MAYDRIAQFSDCVSEAERSQRFTLTLVNGIVWIGIIIAVLSTMGMALLFVGFSWLMSRLLAEYNVRTVQAIGATVSPTQFPEVYKAAKDVCDRLGMPEVPRIIILPSGEMNALAVQFARKRVVVILSELLNGVIDDPARLRFLLGHEICHHALDHGGRGVFEIYKPPKYRQARELTCDNAGVVAADDLPQAKTVLKMLCVGRHLHDRVDEEALIAESHQIYSGLTGWFVRSYLTHPPAGARLLNATRFHEAHGAPALRPVTSSLALG